MSIARTRKRTVTIGSWNINSLRLRLPLLDMWIKHTSPDIFLLQETKVQDVDFPKSFFDDRCYHVSFWGEKSYNGVAIASKSALHKTQRVCLNGGQGQARYLQAETDHVRVASIYVPNGKSVSHLSYQDKLAFMDHVADHVRPYVLHPFPTVLGGDWNIAPHNEDVPDPFKWHNRLLFSAPERKSWETMIHQGWCDSICTQSHQKNEPTWWDYRKKSWEQGYGLRIDAFLLSPWTMDRIYDYQVLSEWRAQSSPSDHAPIQIKMQVEDPM